MKKIYLNGCKYYFPKYSLLGPANFRNEATHERSFKVRDSGDVRSKTFEFFIMIIRFKNCLGQKVKKIIK